MTMLVLYYLIAALLVIVGFMGTVLPTLPGLPLMFGGFLLAAWAEGFHRIGVPTLTLLIILTVIGVCIDFFAGILGAKKSGASKQALSGAFIGALIGLFFGLAGIVFGPVIGAMIGEWHARRDHRQAGKVGLATFVGFIIGTAAKIGCAFAMLFIFLFALFL